MPLPILMKLPNIKVRENQRRNSRFIAHEHWKRSKMSKLASTFKLFVPNAPVIPQKSLILYIYNLIQPLSLPTRKVKMSVSTAIVVSKDSTSQLGR
jgi:hypothetical protein